MDRSLRVLVVVLAVVATATSFLSSTVPPRAFKFAPHASAVINHEPILINGDINFTAANGVRSGRGTSKDPFVISDWGIESYYFHPAISILNTRSFFVIFNVTAADDYGASAVVFTNVSHGRIEASTLQGYQSPRLLLIDSSSDVTIASCEFGFAAGPKVVDSDRITFTNNSIQLILDIDSSTNMTLHTNTFLYGGVRWQGSTAIHFASHIITPDNLAQGKPVLYYTDCADRVVDGVVAGQVLVANCDRVRVSNLTMDDSPDCYAKDAIQLAFVRHANVTSNRIGYCRHAILLHASTDSIVTGNMVRENAYGITLEASSGIRVFHNDLIGMDPTSYTLAEDDRGPENNWSAAYPIGGNYWSRQNTPDRCSGPLQNNCTVPDGIVDSPFVVDANTTDPYPQTLPATFVDQAPIVVLTVPPPPVYPGQLVSVDTNGSRDSDGRFWFLGWDVDGPAVVSPGPGTIFYFTFQEARVYYLTLTAQDDIGVRSNASANVTVTTPPPQPTAQFRITIDSLPMDSAVVGDTLTFDGSASSTPQGSIVHWSWNFGDGAGADGPVVTHAYSTLQIFYPTLFVENDQNQVSSAYVLFNVLDRPAVFNYSSSAGFTVPIPTDWARGENVVVGDSTYQLVLTGPSATNNRATQIGVLTERDPTVEETSTYLSGIVDQVVSGARANYTDSYLYGSPVYRPISGHASVTFAIRYPSENVVQEATVVVSEVHERFWLLLLTVDSSLFTLGHHVLRTMDAGFEITLAPPPPSTSLGLPAIVVIGGVIAAIVAFLVVLVVFASRRKRSAGPGPMPSQTRLATPGFVSRACSNCGTTVPPAAHYCPQCGVRLG